jgi:pimeloyl-ACP methyl ester carboxylesterase
MSTRIPISYGLTGSGPGVLLLHGLGGDRHQSLTLLPDDFPATRVVPEMPGHGETDLVEGETLDFATFAQLAADLIDDLRHHERLASGPIPVVGVSMGAGVALALAWARPDLVRSMVLVRPSWSDVAPPPNMAAFLLVADLLRELGPTEGAAAFRTTPTYQALAQTAPAMAESLLGQFRRRHAQRRARVLADMPMSLPLPDRDAYKALDVDTLVVAAPRDPVHSEDVAHRLAEWIPHARLATVPRKTLDSNDHQTALQRLVATALHGSLRDD